MSEHVLPLRRLSILMPVYNEAVTVASAVKRVLDVAYPCEVELVVVDDGSVDATPDILQTFDDERLQVVRHARNGGKGAAIRTAVEQATGDYMIICDADLEYAPEEIPSLLAPVIAGEASVVYGTRTFGSHTAYSFWYVMGNKTVTMFANVVYDCWISDLETCFKLMPLDLYRRMQVRSAGFGMEAEVTGKLLRSGRRPYEVPISYKARSRQDGKKLTWKDGVEALWILTRERLRGPESPLRHERPKIAEATSLPLQRLPEAAGTQVADRRDLQPCLDHPGHDDEGVGF